MFSQVVAVDRKRSEPITKNFGNFLCYDWSLTINKLDSDNNRELLEFRLFSECTSNVPDSLKLEVEAEISISEYRKYNCSNGCYVNVCRKKHEGEETMFQVEFQIDPNSQFSTIRVDINAIKVVGVPVDYPNFSPTVKLDVGGTIFHTTEQCLEGRIKTHYEIEKYKFKLEHNNKADTDGQVKEMDPVFYDRDPKHFRLILNFLRDGKVGLPDSDKEVEEILEEAKFYDLIELSNYCTDHLSRKSSRNSTPVVDIVQLDIGGTIFKTTKSTLTRFNGMFKTMLDNEISVKKQDFESIFIDRSPKHFDIILNFMRDGDVELPETNRELREVSKEAQYYLLGGLVEKCENYIDNIVVA
ncbi:hypothetical protein GCK72_007409 [Caenorhabditis remanei]|uniref:BTB domain-containing protein n=1 Tax=Caenorhabditis remanei TaxID=31234 RepID=A0A6A5HH92_CAERE|nr:hypothetical protein GCK72_007409 [Caenorhabditis remanei]KAF1767450.1 hypothetical protein GCK72_007409 [Caenorhabditis remanei]